MHLTPDSEQLEIIAAATSLLDHELGSARLHGATMTPHAVDDRALQVLAENGWVGVATPHDLGGAGLSVVEEALLFVEIGRRLGPPRALLSSLAVRIAASCGDAARVRALTTGELAAGLAAVEDGDPQIVDGQLCGVIRFYGVHDGAPAVCLLGDRALLLDCGTLVAAAQPCLDAFMSMTRAGYVEMPVLASIEAPMIAQTASLLVTAMLLGIAEAARDMAVAHAKIRQAFGRPIGAFQAVRHPCADMAAQCELLKAQLYWACAAVRDGRPDAALHVAAARTLAETTARSNADKNIHLHGAMGYTDDIDAHLLLKRTLMLSRWFESFDERLALVLQAGLSRD